ncbi:hypothetical protein niasHT_005127 [Heterodera trifolii]|uniref:ADP/ATP translocase n=1 Tax=Heterodera trifolii TaxID=157864 RepID=A0ABD2M4B1_9BILA
MAFKELFKRWCVTESDRSANYRRFVAGNLLAGGLAGSVTFFFIYPLDFSRTRLAVDMGKDVATREFKGLVDCFAKIAKHDGIIGLYRGFVPSLYYIFLYRSLYYGLFDSFKVFVATTEDENGTGRESVPFWAAFCIGQCSAFLAALFSYPLDTVRRRLMMQSGKAVPDYANAWHCIREIHQHEGGRAFFSGFFVNAIRGVRILCMLIRLADICGADICGADTCGADICGAQSKRHLRRRHLRRDTCGADTCGDDTCGADRCGAQSKGLLRRRHLRRLVKMTFAAQN